MARSISLMVAICDPRGRCNRRGLLVAALVLLATEITAGLALWHAGFGIGDAPAWVLKGAVCYAALAAVAQRLHDTGRSAWMILWALLAWLVLAFAVVLATAIHLPPELMQTGELGFLIVMAAIMLPMLATLFWLHLAPGEPASNRYGPVPSGLGFSLHVDRSRPIREGVAATAG